MYVNVEFCMVSVDQNALPLLEDHGRPAGSSCFHRKIVLWGGWDEEHLLQSCV